MEIYLLRPAMEQPLLSSFSKPTYRSHAYRPIKLRCSDTGRPVIGSIRIEGGGSIITADCVIVGGGISGLFIAQARATKHPNVVPNVIVTEAKDRVGGNIITREEECYLWEEGPNSFQPSDSMLTMVPSYGKSQVNANEACMESDPVTDSKSVLAAPDDFGFRETTSENQSGTSLILQNSSFLWIKYMALMLTTMADIEKARSIAKPYLLLAGACQSQRGRLMPEAISARLGSKAKLS